MCTIVLLDVWI